jgi:hypothetical protein
MMKTILRLRARPVLAVLLIGQLALAQLALAQSSPFLTGATALQTNILAWLTPIAIILIMVLGCARCLNKNVTALGSCLI